MNERDASVIHNLFAGYHYADDLGVIKSKLTEYVATVRKEARAAAFRDATAAVHEILVGNRDMFTVFDYVKDTIEAAANSEEGARDGKHSV